MEIDIGKAFIFCKTLSTKKENKSLYHSAFVHIWCFRRRNANLTILKVRDHHQPNKIYKKVGKKDYIISFQEYLQIILLHMLKIITLLLYKEVSIIIHCWEALFKYHHSIHEYRMATDMKWLCYNASLFSQTVLKLDRIVKHFLIVLSLNININLQKFWKEDNAFVETKKKKQKYK